jgi:hypothetical protein
MPADDSPAEIDKAAAAALATPEAIDIKAWLDADEARYLSTMDRKKSYSWVQAMLDRGAQKITLVNEEVVYPYPEDPDQTVHHFARLVILTLPTDPEQRKAIFAQEAGLAGAQHRDPRHDTGQKYLDWEFSEATR